MTNASSHAQISPGFTSDLDSDRLEDLTAEMRWSRYSRGVTLGALRRHQRGCRPCQALAGATHPEVPCLPASRLLARLQRHQEDVQALADALVPGPAQPPGTLF